jgi:hypothetical protein
MIINIVGVRQQVANNYGSAEDYRKLTDYIKKIYDEYHLEPSWALLLSQVKDICKKYGLKYSEVLSVIKYITQIEEIDITKMDTLGLVPYYIDRADRYIQRYREVSKEIKNFERSENTIKLKPFKQTERKKKKNENFD